MHRLPVDTETLLSSSPALSRSAAAHLRAVRPKAGEEIELFDGRGGTRLFRCEGEGRLVPAGEPVFRGRRPAEAPVLFACITKGQRWDWTVAKAVELGVSRIVPVLSARTIVRIEPGDRAAKRERWLRIAEDAARQSGAVWLPEIDEAAEFADALALAGNTVCFAGILSDPPPPPLLDCIEAAVRGGAAAQGRPFSVFVGPEGDFTPEEAAALARTARPCSFGPAILRAETAAIFGLSVLAASIHRGL